MPTIKELIAHEVADFFAGYGSPGFPDVESGAAQSDLISRINQCIDLAVKESGLLDVIDTTPLQVSALAQCNAQKAEGLLSFARWLRASADTFDAHGKKEWAKKNREAAEVAETFAKHYAGVKA